MIPLGELKKWLHDLPQGMEAVCSYATRQRSMPAVRTLAAAGSTANFLKNGKISWQMARLPVMKGMPD